ncbi:tetratricopeptide repeat protein [Planctomycetota bacterium]
MAVWRLLDNRTIAWVTVFLGLVLSVCGDMAFAVSSSNSATPTESVTSENLSSRSVAQMFYRRAFELTYGGDVQDRRPHQAALYLLAARQLDPQLMDACTVLFDIVATSEDPLYAPIVTQWLLDSSASVRETYQAKKAVRYLVALQKTGAGREGLLQQLQQRIGAESPRLNSELLTHLGLLAKERSGQRGAYSYFLQAYKQDKYNKLAFNQLAELAPDQISASTTLEHLRLALGQNPLDLDSAMALAQYVERLQLFDIAAGSYAYCVDLYEYLYGNEPLPGHIYIPWAVSSYNSTRNLEQVIRITDKVRKSGRFDLFLEGIAGKAAIKAGNQKLGQQILTDAETHAIELAKQSPGATVGKPDAASANGKPLAWYYCFVRENPTQALDWANRAYAQDPNGSAILGILAYALVLNQQYQWALPLLDKGETNQITELARARLQLAQGDRIAAKETLLSSVTRDPGSLAGEKGRALLAKEGYTYKPPFDAQTLLGDLVGTWGERIVPSFTQPDQAFSARLATINTAITYGGHLGGVLTIVNQSDEPLMIGPLGLFQGKVRVDAKVEGDLNKSFPDLLTHTLFPQQVVAPRRSTTAQLPLLVGPLRELLLTYPQASVNVLLTVYLDPAMREDGTPWNRLADMQPISITIGRPGVQVSERSLRTQYNAIALDDVRAKIETAKLFVGLLREQHAMAQHGRLYRFRYADWLPGWLTSALTHESGLLLSPSDTDWEVKVNTLDMLHDGLPLNDSIMQALAGTLRLPQWPIRLLTLTVLAQQQSPGFDQMLQWTAKHDTNAIVRRMAELLHQP